MQAQPWNTGTDPGYYESPGGTEQRHWEVSLQWQRFHFECAPMQAPPWFPSLSQSFTPRVGSPLPGSPAQPLVVAEAAVTSRILKKKSNLLPVLLPHAKDFPVLSVSIISQPSFIHLKK